MLIQYLHLLLAISNLTFINYLFQTIKIEMDRSTFEITKCYKPSNLTINYLIYKMKKVCMP